MSVTKRFKNMYLFQNGNMGQKPLYQARTAEEFGKLEERTNRFLEHYAIKGQGQICVSAGGLEGGGVNMFPDKYGKIEEVCPITQQPKGVLIRSTPEFVVFDVDETRYMVKYNPDKDNS